MIMSSSPEDQDSQVVAPVTLSLEEQGRQDKIRRVVWRKVVDGVSEMAACRLEDVAPSTFKMWKAKGYVDRFAQELNDAVGAIARTNQALAYHTLIDTLPELVSRMVEYAMGTSTDVHPKERFEAQIRLFEALRYLMPKDSLEPPRREKDGKGEEEHLAKWSFEPNRQSFRVTNREDGTLVLEVAPPKIIEQESAQVSTTLP